MKERDFADFPAGLFVYSCMPGFVIVRYGKGEIKLDRDAIYVLEHLLRTHLDCYNMGHIKACYTRDRVCYPICGKYNENGIFDIPSFLCRQTKEFVGRCFSGIARKIWGRRLCKHHILSSGMKDKNSKECKQSLQKQQAKK